MFKRCVLCGNRRITGKKYCSECKTGEGAIIRKNRRMGEKCMIALVFSGVFSVFITEKIFPGFVKQMTNSSPSLLAFSIFLILFIGLLLLFFRLFGIIKKKKNGGNLFLKK